MAKRTKATPRELAILKVAKKRGLIRIDLRKPLTAYARKRARLFEGVYMGSTSVITVDRETAGAIKRGGELFVKGKQVLVPKLDINERPRFDKKAKKLVSKMPDGSNREIEIRYLPKTLPKNKRYMVPFASRNGKMIYKYFDTFDKMAKVMREYETQRYHDWREHVEIIDETSIPGRGVSWAMQFCMAPMQNMIFKKCSQCAFLRR